MIAALLVAGAAALGDAAAHLYHTASPSPPRAQLRGS